MAILVGVAASLGATRPARGRAVLLFQPSEETGEGARRILDDPAFAPLRPDVALALHNLPGFPEGSIVMRRGPFAAASCGLMVELRGATAHAAEPHRGRTPAPAVATLIDSWSALPQHCTALDDPAKVTIVHARLGELAFGTSPGEATVAATIRATTDETLELLLGACERVATHVAHAHDLDLEIRRMEPFPATENDADLVRALEEVALGLEMDVVTPPSPFPWSEDFGHFRRVCPSLLFGLGAGEDAPALHHPTYDFPDAILDRGVDILTALCRHLLAT